MSDGCEGGGTYFVHIMHVKFHCRIEPFASKKYSKREKMYPFKCDKVESLVKKGLENLPNRFPKLDHIYR